MDTDPSIAVLDVFKKELLSFLDADEVFLYWKGRVGLFSILKALGIGAGDEVILPAYTCVVVPNAICYLHATPVYVDISADTYNSNIDKIEPAVTDKTKVIICQNTYGLSSNLDAITALANKHGLFTIEDCTHGFGGKYNGIPNGSSCDAAFFSTQWSKPFSTGVGGFVTTKDIELGEKLRELSASLLEPSKQEIMNLKMLYFVRKHLLNDLTYWPMIKLYRWLSKHNLILGSSSREEYEPYNIPPNYEKSFSTAQVREGVKNLKTFPSVLKRRRVNATIYTEFLEKHEKHHVPKPLFNNHSFLSYPILAKNRDKIIKLAEKHCIRLGDWFVSPLHPVTENLDAWQLKPEKYPISSYISAHVINLPTDTCQPEKVLSFLEKYFEELL